MMLGRRDFLACSAGGALALFLPGEAPARPVLSELATRALRSAVRGPVLLPQSSGYERGRLVYNTRFEGIQPDAVVEPLDARDVQAVVRWARRFGVRIVAKAGGHSYAGYSTIGSGVVVDLRRMRGISVNIADREAMIGAGAQLIDVYATLAAQGVTVPAGSCPSVGLAGHALGGGMGLAGRRLGLLSDNVTALTIVTADGRIRRADSNTNEDIFWASCGGGGGNFGIATSLSFRIHCARRASWFNINWPWPAASAALEAWQELAPDAPDALTSMFYLMTSGGEVPIVSASGQYFGSVAALRRLIAPLTRLGGQLSIGESAYMQLMLRWAGCLDNLLRACHTHGTRPGGSLPRAAFYAKSDFVSRQLPTLARATMIEWIERRNRAPSLGSGALLLDSYGGAINRVRADATAFVHRDQLFCIQYLAYFNEPAAGQPAQSWIRGVHSAMRPFVSGQAYQNYLDPDLEWWQHAYYAENLGRLREIKKAVDPDFFFRFPQAIPPAS